MDHESAVDRLYADAISVISALEKQQEISLQITTADNFRKALLLAAASNFEHQMSAHVLQFVRECSGNSYIENLVRIKAITRQYHTWFKWDENNANQFFAMFGPNFKSLMIQRVKESSELQAQIQAFLAIGNERNRLVHGDYATFALEKTLDEIYDLYKQASLFVNALPNFFRAA